MKMNDYRNHRADINQLFDAPQYRRLKYWALTVIGFVIAIQIAMIIWADEIDDRVKLLMQGVMSLGAIAFVVLVTVIAYKVYSEYFRDRYGNDKGNKTP